VAAATEIRSRAGRREDHDERCAEERYRQRRFGRQAQPRQVQHERLFAHAPAVHRQRQHLDDERNWHEDSQVRDRHVQAKRVADRPVEADEDALHGNRAAKTGGQRLRRISELAEAGRQALDSLADPFLMQRSQGREQHPDTVGQEQDGNGDGEGADDTRPEEARSDRADRLAHARGHGRADGCGKDQPQEPDAAIDQHDRRRQRLRADELRAVPNPDDVAADVRRQEIIEKRRDEVRVRQRPDPRRDVLGVQQDAPAPHADENHAEVQRERCGEPGDRRRPHGVPQACEIHAGQQDP